MIKLHKLIIIFPFFLAGCKPNIINDTKLIQSIDSLDMNIFSNKGEKIYSIKSPNTNYDKVKNAFYLKSTTINLYKNQKIKYIIKSEESKLHNNNKIIELNGNVEVISVDKDKDKLYAKKFYWNIDDNKYILSGKVHFENKNIILNSNKATLNKENIIEFFNPVKYVIKKDNNEKSYEVNSENAYYDTDAKSVTFKSSDKRVRSKIYF